MSKSGQSSGFIGASSGGVIGGSFLTDISDATNLTASLPIVLTDDDISLRNSDITTLGTLSTLTVDNIIIDGSTIGHIGQNATDSDLLTLANNTVTVAGAMNATTVGGALSTAAQLSVTSLGTLTTLTVDDVVINGTTIGHTSDTDLMTLTSGTLTVAGEVSATTLDIGGTNITATASEINLIDGGATVGIVAFADGDGIIHNDAGTMRVSSVQNLAAYLDDEITVMPNLTSVGTLTTLTVDNVIINGTTIGHTSDTDLMTLTSGTLTVAGDINLTGDIVLQNNDYISNPSDYIIRMMPEGTSATDYGIEFDFSGFGYGVVLTSIKASDESDSGNIKFDSNLVINTDTDLTFGSNSHSRMRFTSTGNNTLQIGVKSTDTVDNCSGAVALIHSSHFGTAHKSPGVNHDNPNLYVYAYNTDANDYIRFEHDGTNANIVTGAGDISLQPAGGVACGDNELSRPKLKDYAETVNAIGSRSTDTTIDLEDGNVQTVTLTDDCEFDFDNWPATGIAGTVTLIITNGGANTTAWASPVKWPGDNAPALTASGVDIVSFMTIDAGTTIYGFVGGIAFA